MLFRKTLYERSKGWIWAAAFLAMLLMPRPAGASEISPIALPGILAELSLWAVAIAVFVAAAWRLKALKKNQQGFQQSPKSNEGAAPAFG